MFPVRMRTIAIGLLGAVTLAGCSSYGRDGYGYGGVSVGMGSGGYYDPYYDPYGYGGWYNDYYYPGSGYYVYDRRGTRHRMRDRDRAYWARVREARRDRPPVRNDNVTAQSVHEAVRAQSGRNRQQYRQQQGRPQQARPQQPPRQQQQRPAVRQGRATGGDNVSARSVHEAVRAQGGGATRSQGRRDRR